MSNYSTLTLYYGTSLHEEKRFQIEFFSFYLTKFRLQVVNNFQYIKHQLVINIKVNMSQSNLDTTITNDLDYVSIKNSTDTRTYYYFVHNKIWKSEETIEMELHMDTLNTFMWNDDYIVDKRTLVLREHKDRIKISERIPITSPLSDEDTSTLSNYFNGTSLEEDYSKRFLINYEKSINEDSYVGSNASVYSDYPYNIYIYLPDQTLFNSYRANFLQIQGGIITIGVPTNPKPQFSLLDGSIGFVVIELDYKENIYGTNPRNMWNIFSEVFNGFGTSFARVIDKYAENINPVLFKKEDNLLLDEDGTSNWYLVYANENAPVDNPTDTESKYVNPVKIMFAKDTPYNIETNTASRKIIFPSMFPKLSNKGEQLGIYYWQIESGAYIEIEGVQYTLSPNLGDGNYNEVRILKEYDNSQVFHTIYLYKEDSSHHNVVSTTKFSNIANVVFYGVSSGYISGWLSLDLPFFENETINGSGQIFDIGSNAQLTSYDSSAFEELDLTLSQLIKIIQLPYAPMKFLSGIGTINSFPTELVWNNEFNLLEILPNKRFDFSWQMTFSYSPFADLILNKTILSKEKQPRDDTYESKFFASEFTQNKFVYDQFTFTFQLELMNIDVFLSSNDYQNFYVEYGVSKRLSSKMFFKFNQYICSNYEKQDYNDVLLCDRNNEIPLFTNAYINYMRTGFQFDQSNKRNSEVARWSGIALSIIGAVASFISTPYTGAVGIASGIGLTTSTIAQVIGAITTQNQQENSIAQKMLQASLQSENVQGSDDVELFDQYGENKARLMKYQPSEVMGKLIKDLFYYGGYATKEYKIPNVATRIYFNYLECELVINHTNNLPDPIINDIIEKFKAGTTIFHRYEQDWDIEQQYENYEVSI